VQKKQKPIPWRVLIGSLLIMLSLFVGLAFNYTILGQPFRTDTTKPPFGREALQPLATVLTIILLAAGLVMVYLGLKNMETK
jgi:RsiW-degrading membrane proteinase PrsW (M82 family)